jgi:hypothetical protein
MAARLTRLSHEIAIQLHLVAESCTICSARSRRPVRKLLDTPSYKRRFGRMTIYANLWFKVLPMALNGSHISEFSPPKPHVSTALDHVQLSEISNLYIFRTTKLRQMYNVHQYKLRSSINHVSMDRDSTGVRKRGDKRS